MTPCSWLSSLKLMYTKLVCQDQNWPSSFWRDLHLCHQSKAFFTKCSPWSTDLSARAQLLSKVVGVPFGFSKDYMLQNLKIIPLSIKSWKHSSAGNNKINVQFCSYSKFSSPIILHITKTKAFKRYEIYFLFHLKSFFGCCNIHTFGRN